MERAHPASNILYQATGRMSEVMSDPVMAADGHAYERTAIERWLATKSTSPLTGGELEHSILVPSHMLRRMIRNWEGARKAA